MLDLDANMMLYGPKKSIKDEIFCVFFLDVSFVIEVYHSFSM